MSIFNAIRRGDADKVRSILEGDAAAATETSKKGEVPLIVAVEAGEEEIVKVLLEFKANVNAVDKTDESALMAAASGKFEDIGMLVGLCSWISE